MQGGKEIPGVKDQTGPWFISTVSLRELEGRPPSSWLTQPLVRTQALGSRVGLTSAPPCPLAFIQGLKSMLYSGSQEVGTS